MNTRIILLVFLLLGITVDTQILQAKQADNPVIYFSDLESGPINSYVTLYGKNFGAETGKVKFGDTDVKILEWSDNQVELQVVADSGNALQLTTHTNQQSNEQPFTLRKGHLYFVSQSQGDDDNSGKSPVKNGPDGPWKTLVNLKKQVKPGDIVYLRNGNYRQILDRGFRSILVLRDFNTGQRGLPIALVGFPGEAPVIGTNDPNGASRAFVLVDGITDWTFAKLRITAKGTGIRLGNAGKKEFQRIRIIGNEFFDSPSSYGTVSLRQCSDCKVLGNHIHDSGKPGSKLAHLIYYEGNGVGANLEIGWNLLHDEQGGRCIQIYGHGETDILTGLLIHDNVAYNCPYDGILVGSSDDKRNQAWIKDASIYNNIIYNSGYKGDSSGVRIDNAGVVARVFHNTLVNNNISVKLQHAQRVEVGNNLSILATNHQEHIHISPGQITSLSIFHNGYVGGSSVPKEDRKSFKSDDARFNDRSPISTTSHSEGFAFGETNSSSNSLTKLAKKFHLQENSPFYQKGEQIFPSFKTPTPSSINNIKKINPNIGIAE